MKRIYLIATVIVSLIILSLSGCQWDDRPLHERIADAMYHDYFDPRWEHLVERYGEEDFRLTRKVQPVVSGLPVLICG